MDEHKRYDVFLCYKSENEQAARALHEALRAAGLLVFLDVIEGPAWAPLWESVKDALLRSRTLVALITEDFPVSPHCREELHIALSAAYYLDNGDTSRVMAVTQGVSPDEVRPRQLTRFRLPRHGRPPAQLVAEIVRGVQRHAHWRFGEAPEPRQPHWHPQELVGDHFFRGRYAELWEIHEGLRARDKNRDHGHPVVAVRGLGGLGKTALCLEYARLFERDHPGGVFLLRLEGSDGRAGLGDAVVRTRYRDQLALIAQSLGIGPEEVAATLERGGEEYLWIVDDVPAGTSQELIAQLCAPTRRGRTLITTRGRFVRCASLEIEPEPLEVEIGGQVLTAHRPSASGDRRAVSEIVTLLGGHPLGLTLAAGLTTLPDFIDYRTLLVELSSTGTDQLEVAAQLGDQLPTGAARPFTNALLRSYGALTDPAKEVLCAASVLAPTVIPRDLLAGMARRVAGLDTGAVAACVQQVAARGLVDLTGAVGYTMHALVARAVRVLVTPGHRRARLRDAALAELTAAVEGTRNSYRHRAVLHHLPHARAVAGLLAGGDDWWIGPAERHLLNETGRTQIESGDTGHALANLQALFEACEDLGTVDATTYHTVLAGLATAYGLEGEYTTALQLKQRAVDGLTRELGPDDLDTLVALNNLGVSHLDLGNHQAAYAIVREVYVRRRNHRSLGPVHRDTLIALNNVAIARGHLGDSAGERQRHRRVAHRYWLGLYARWQRVARPDDPYPLDALNGLALSYRALGMLDDALATIDELLARRRALLGPDHPDTLGTLENKLILQEELRQRGPDETFQRLVLKRLQGQGPAHHRTRTTLRNLIRGEIESTKGAASSPAELPDGVTPGDVCLDGDHVDEEIDLQQLAVALQQERVDGYGSDDPRTMIATSYLAYALALGGHLDGQLHTAGVLAEDAFSGLADAADDGADHLGAHDVEVARLIHEWIVRQIDQSGD